MSINVNSPQVHKKLTVYVDMTLEKALHVFQNYVFADSASSLACFEFVLRFQSIFRLLLLQNCSYRERILYDGINKCYTSGRVYGLGLKCSLVE